MSKISVPLIFVVLSLLLIGVIVYYSPRPPVTLPSDYEVIFSKPAQLPGGESILLYGFRAKNEQQKPGSYLEIRSVKDDKTLYKFAPAVPASVSYPRPLMLEKVAVMTQENELYILTTWGETGADYFGTHPLLVRYKNGEFRVVKFYKGYLSDLPNLRYLPWTTKDFEIANQFNTWDKVFTILTQGVAVTKDNMIELRFFGDDKPHAAEHQYVIFTFPLPPVR